MPDYTDAKKYLIRLIARFKSAAAMKLLSDVLSRERDNSDLVETVLDNLVVPPGADVYPAISFLEQSSVKSIQKKLASFYGRFQEARSAGYLQHLLAVSGSEDVQASALRALGELGDRENFKYAVPFLDLPSKDLQAAAIFACGKLGDHSVIPFLARFQHSSDNTIISSLAEAYLAMGDVQELVRLLHTVNTNNLTNIIIGCLGRSRNDNSRQSIWKFLSHKDDIVRLAALRALEGFGDFALLQFIIENFSSFPVLYHQQIVNTALSVASANREKSESFVTDFLAGYAARQAMSLLEKNCDAVFHDLLVRIVRNLKSGAPNKDWKEFFQLLDGLSATSSGQPFFMFDLLIRSSDDRVRNEFLSVNDKKHLARKVAPPSDDSVILMLKIASKFKIAACRHIALYLLGIDNQILVSEALQFLQESKSDSIEQMKEVLLWIFNTSHNDKNREKAVEVLCNFNNRPFLSVCEEKFPNESLSMKSCMLESFGRMGLKNNLFLLNKLCDANQRDLALSYFKALIHLGGWFGQHNLVDELLSRYQGDMEIELFAAKALLRNGRIEEADSLFNKNFVNAEGESLQRAFNLLSDVLPTDNMITVSLSLLLNNQSSKQSFGFLQKNLTEKHLEFLARFFLQL
ncbi:MAG: HEAT repeat domain-containing protein [Candidatus Wallbacteria bacterium]|nr:HEAT repeat domain-containing protein [Candidatus Wallbacteria bacterium]